MTMNGIFLLLPFLMIRFLLPFILNPKSLARAAYFAPVQGREKAAYYIYQISNIAMFVYLLFLNVLIENSWQFLQGLSVTFWDLAYARLQWSIFLFLTRWVLTIRDFTSFHGIQCMLLISSAL